MVRSFSFWLNERVKRGVNTMVDEDLRLVVFSRYISKGPFLIKDSSLNCADSQLFSLWRQRGYAEILADLEQTHVNNILWVAYYFDGIWRDSVPAEEMQLCKKCSKNLVEYAQKKMTIKRPQLQKLFESNRALIRRALTSWSKGESEN
jgi:hypothetical protein